MKRFQVAVFGKQGCDKCRVLKDRLKKILAEDPYADFELIYFDLGTVEGLVRFCQCETLNPQRIPSFMVFGKEEGPVLRPLSHRTEIPGSAFELVETLLSLETDYASTGTLTPGMIRRVLDTALKNQETKIQVL